MDAFLQLVAGLQKAEARFVVFGVWGVNYYAASGSTLFTTLDRDLYLPRDSANLLLIWKGCESLGLKLWAGNEPLGTPLDRTLADRVVQQKALTKATDDHGLQVDLSLVMSGFEFEKVWEERRVFRVDDVEVPVARLGHIVTSKAKANRPKDRLFLETHAEALRELGNED